MLAIKALLIVIALLLLAVWFTLLKLQRKITMSDAANAQALRDLKTQLDKVKTEILAKVDELEKKIEQAGSTPETDAALADLRGSVQGLDDLNPDAPAPSPSPEPTAARHGNKRG